MRDCAHINYHYHLDSTYITHWCCAHLQQYMHLYVSDIRWYCACIILKHFLVVIIPLVLMQEITMQAGLRVLHLQPQQG